MIRKLLIAAALMMGGVFAQNQVCTQVYNPLSNEGRGGFNCLGAVVKSQHGAPSNPCGPVGAFAYDLDAGANYFCPPGGGNWIPQGTRIPGTPAYTAAAAMLASMTVTAVTHGQGIHPVAFCYDNAVPANYVFCQYTVATNGDVAFSWNPAFTGSIAIIGGTGGFPDPTATKGEIIVHCAGGTSKLAAQANGQVLTLDSTQTCGLKWATPASASIANNGTNGVLYVDGSGNIVGAVPGGAGTLCLKQTAGGVPFFGSCAGTASTEFSSLTNPTGNLALSMAHFTTTWTYDNATGAAATMFTVTDTAANTGTGPLVRFTTAAGSAASPFQSDSNGNGIKVTADGALHAVGTGALAADMMPALTGDCLTSAGAVAVTCDAAKIAKSTAAFGVNSALMPNATSPAAYVINATAGDVVVYTTPSNMRALVYDMTYTNGGANTVAFYPEIKVSGSYYQLAPGISVIASTLTTSGYAPSNPNGLPPIILNAGESLAVHTNNDGMSALFGVIQFSATSPLRTVRLLSLSSADNTLYTSPAGTFETLSQVASSVSAGFRGRLYYFNASGGTRTIVVSMIPSGGSATAFNTLYSTTVPSGSSGSLIAPFLPGNLGTGDIVNINTDAATATQIAWINVIEH